MNSLLAALIICALITAAAGTALGVGYPHPRRRRRQARTAAVQAAEQEAEAWTAPMRPVRSLTGLRLRRDLRRWLPVPGRKLP